MNKTVLLLLIVLLSAPAAFADDLAGIWSAQNGLFVLTFGANGSYRAVNTDQQFCTLCAGGGPLVETGTYQVADGTVTITIASSNASNKNLRIGKPMEVPFQAVGGSVTFGNVQKLTFDWTSVASIEMVQHTTAVEHKTWRAVKELFR